METHLLLCISDQPLKHSIAEGGGPTFSCAVYGSVSFPAGVALNVINMPTDRTVGGSIDAKDNSSSILKLAAS